MKWIDKKWVIGIIMIQWYLQILEFNHSPILDDEIEWFGVPRDSWTPVHLWGLHGINRIFFMESGGLAAWNMVEFPAWCFNRQNHGVLGLFSHDDIVIYLVKTIIEPWNISLHVFYHL